MQTFAGALFKLRLLMTNLTDYAFFGFLPVACLDTLAWFAWQRRWRWVVRTLGVALLGALAGLALFIAIAAAAGVRQGPNSLGTLMIVAGAAGLLLWLVAHLALMILWGGAAVDRRAQASSPMGQDTPVPPRPQ